MKLIENPLFCRDLSKKKYSKNSKSKARILEINKMNQIGCHPIVGAFLDSCKQLFFKNFVAQKVFSNDFWKKLKKSN